MAPLKPFWTQPSHPDIQEVIFPTDPSTDFTTKSLSKITVPPCGLFARLEFPPCTKATAPTYATVQMGRGEHLNLNSDLVYINHSCEPSLIFDLRPSSMGLFAGPKGLKPGDELTFFYPSTEWDMAQGFSCFCGTEKCRGFISGAKNMNHKQLSGMWLNPHIHSLLTSRLAEPTTNSHSPPQEPRHVSPLAASDQAAGRRGITSRELSGEMGGDTDTS